MNITAIKITNHVGARSINLSLTTAVTLIAGQNGAGKSSIIEAVRLALVGEPQRVSLKKDYAELLSKGAENGCVTVTLGGDKQAFITLPAGKTHASTEFVAPKALPFVLDAQRFSGLAANERRSFLFGLMGLSLSGDAVIDLLLAKGCNATMVAAIMPSLKSGFEAANKEAATKAREEKAVWRTHTGETYGDVKAKTWHAPKPDADASALVSLKAQLTAVNLDITSANKDLGMAEGNKQRAIDAAALLANARQEAAKCARATDKLLRDEKDLAAWLKKVEEAREKAQGGTPVTCACPECGWMLAISNGTLRAFDADKEQVADPEAKAALPALESALALLQSAVKNGKRDVLNAEVAAQSIADLEAKVKAAPAEAYADGVRALLAELARKHDAIAQQARKIEEDVSAAKTADRTTACAKAAHIAVEQWQLIADALAPDGIPADLLTKSLKPINARLLLSSKLSEWPLVQITPDMRITAGGVNHYMLSASGKWRTDAMIAEAIAHLSGIKVLLLDAFDLLDTKGREDLVAWLDTVAHDGDIETVIVCGTLKAAPTGLPDTFTAHWIEGGVLTKDINDD